jgi:Nucleotidyl transferase AbiEii toxin, Type IV TA system
MHQQILSESQQKLLPFVKSLRKEYYLVGGTAIALHIGHRMSIDFDLFKKSNVNRTKIAKTLESENIDFKLIFADSESFHIIADGVKLTFFQYPFDIPSKPLFETIRLPNLLDLAAMKAYALGRRAKWKDYVDLYFILRDFHSIEEITMRTQELFKEVFSAKLFRQQLCYFEDIDYTEEVSFLENFAVSETTIKDFLTTIATKGL